MLGLARENPSGPSHPGDMVELRPRKEGGPKAPATNLTEGGSPRTLAESRTCKQGELPEGAVDARGWPIFHVFEYRGRKLLYAPVSGALMEVTDAAFDVLQAGWESSCDELTARLGQRHPPERIRSAVDDIELLKRARVLIPAGEPGEKQIEAHIRSLMRHPPYRISLFVTQTCNLRCVYCYEFGEDGNYLDAGRKMTLETALAAVNYLFRAAAPRRHVSINFFGGEPLLNFPVIEAVVKATRQRAHAHGKTCDFTMTTNAIPLSDRAIDFLVKHDFSLCVSFDGPPEINDRFRPTKNGKGAGRIAIRNALRLLARHHRKGAVKVRATCTRDNRDVRALADYFQGLSFTNVGLGAALGKSYRKAWYDLDVGDQWDFYRRQEAYLDHVLETIRQRRHVSYNPFRRILHRVSHPRAFLGTMCGVGRNTNAIGVDGTIYPCHRYMGLEPYRLGDIHCGLDPEKLYTYYRKVVNNARARAGLARGHPCLTT